MDNTVKVNFSAQEWAKNNARERDEYISNAILDYIEKKLDRIYIYDKRTEGERTKEDGSTEYNAKIELFVSPLPLEEDENTELTYAFDVYEINELMKYFQKRTPLKLFKILGSNHAAYGKYIERIKLKEGV